jgi:hypothetical protein
MVFLTVTIINCHETTKHMVTSNAFILVLLALQARYIVESARGKIDSNIHHHHQKFIIEDNHLTIILLLYIIYYIRI